MLISLILCLSSEKLIVNKFYFFTLDFFFNLGSFSILFTILCIFTLINSLNLADGINGLATGLIFFWLLYINYIYENNLNILSNNIKTNYQFDGSSIKINSSKSLIKNTPISFNGIVDLLPFNFYFDIQL